MFFQIYFVNWYAYSRFASPLFVGFDLGTIYSDNDNNQIFGKVGIILFLYIKMVFNFHVSFLILSIWEYAFIVYLMVYILRLCLVY